MRWTILLWLFIIPSLAYCPMLDPQYLKVRDTIALMPYSDFSEDNLRTYLKSHPLTPIIIAQARLESGNYTSRIFRESNNLFGMRHPRVRPTVSLGSKYHHAVYEHWTASVDDYLLWLDYTKWNKDKCIFSHLIAKRYAQDKHYIVKLKNLI